MRLLQLLQKELGFFFQTLRRTLRLSDIKNSTSSERRKYLIRGAGIAVLAGFGMVFLLFLFTLFGVFGRIPSVEELINIENDNASELYSEDNRLIGKYYIQNRSDADIEDISSFLTQALIATEDARFFEHSGIDFKAMMRVLGKTILMQKDEAGGGSTISQQLVKNLYGRKQYRMFTIVINKFREMIIARRLENVYSKEGLLNLYLNTVPFSDNVFGVKVASNRFFNTTPKNIKIEEAAVMIGMLKANTTYDPVRHPERALQRRNVVLKQMEKYGYLEPAACDSLSQLPLKLKYSKDRSQLSGLYYQEYIKKEIEDLLLQKRRPDGAPYNLYTDGLKIYTTINASMQKYAEEAVQKHMAELQANFQKSWKGKKPWGDDEVLIEAMKKSARYQALKKNGTSEEEIKSIFNTPIKIRIFDWKNGEAIKEMTPLDSIKYYMTILHTGFLAVEPQTGKIRAWVGGIDYRYFQYDHVTSARQVGSTFKPIVYTEALRQGISPCNYFQNALVSYPEYKNWQPKNSDGVYGGFYSMAGGLSKSVNTITVEILLQSGIDPVRKLAREMGIRGDIPKAPAIALGAVDASLKEMVMVYATYANRGRRPELYSISKIEDSNGNVIFDAKSQQNTSFKQIIAPEHADMMTKMLQTVVDSGTARRLRYHYGLNGDIAGKTGTTQNQSDGWFIGYTPNLVAGAWVGAESPRVHFRTLSAGQGASTALPIWGHFMRSVYNNKSFSNIRNARFTVASEAILIQLDCPPFLSDSLLNTENYFEQDSTGYLRDLFQKNRAPSLTPEDLQDGINPEERATLDKTTDRQQKKDERKEKLRQLWSEKLFGKKDNN